MHAKASREHAATGPGNRFLIQCKKGGTEEGRRGWGSRRAASSPTGSAEALLPQYPTRSPFAQRPGSRAGAVQGRGPPNTVLTAERPVQLPLEGRGPLRSASQPLVAVATPPPPPPPQARRSIVMTTNAQCCHLQPGPCCPRRRLLSPCVFSVVACLGRQNNQVCSSPGRHVCAGQCRCE